MARDGKPSARALLKQADVHTLLRLPTGILTPRSPARRPLGPSLILRSRRIQVWLKDEALEDSANLPAPEVIAASIDSPLPSSSPFGLGSTSSIPMNFVVEDLQAALAQFAEIAPISNTKQDVYRRTQPTKVIDDTVAGVSTYGEKLMKP
jgi:hypothetical protein